METWMTLIVCLFSSAVTAPGFAQLTQDLSAWIRYPGRHTWTHLWSIMPPERQPTYTSVVDWIRRGQWEPGALWAGWVRWADARCCQRGSCSELRMTPCGIKPVAMSPMPAIGGTACDRRRRKWSKRGDSTSCSW